MAHRTLIDGTGYDIKSGRTLILGTGYNIKKGRTLIGGTGYDIKFGTPVGELDVGTSVYMNVDSVRTEFQIAQQGRPNGKVYDETCNGTWVLSKNIPHVFDSASYISSWSANAAAQKYASETYLGLLDPWIQDIIVTANYPDGQVPTDEDTTAYKITVPHPYEIRETSNTLIVQLALFANETGVENSIATYNGTATSYFLRRAYKGTSKYYYVVCSASGAITDVEYSYTKGYGLRPMFIIPQETLVDGNFDLMAS